MTVLVVTPTNREARTVPGAVASGAGAAAREGLLRLLEGQRPPAVLLAGWCGGLDPSLAPGDIILAREALSTRQELRPSPLLFDTARREFRHRHLRFVSSRLLTVDQPVATPVEKIALWNEFGAAGVDMETAALAEILEGRGIPWLAVRVVLDSAHWGLPSSLASWAMEGDERTALRRALFRPWEWWAYLRLARAIGPAQRSLRRAATVARRALESAPLETLPMVAPTPKQ